MKNLIAKLIEDDDFRRRFEKDPVGVAKEMDIDLTKEQSQSITDALKSSDLDGASGGGVVTHVVKTIF